MLPSPSAPDVLHGPSLIPLLRQHPRPWYAEPNVTDPMFVFLIDGNGCDICTEPAAYGRLIAAAVSAFGPQPGETVAQAMDRIGAAIVFTREDLAEEAPDAG